MADKFTQCPVCGKAVKQPKTGRPRVYDSDRCKEKDKRRREKDKDRTSVAQAANVSGSEFGIEPRLCHVCGLRPASRGSPSPLLCTSCTGAA